MNHENEEDDFFGPPPLVCVWCQRPFFDEEMMTVAKHDDGEKLYHGGCFAKWTKSELAVVEIGLIEAHELKVPETSQRLHQKQK